jgi:hypothetical protein
MAVYRNIIIYDLLTDELQEYTSIKQASNDIQASTAVIERYANANTDGLQHIAKGRYIITFGKEHEKTVEVRLSLHPVQLKILNRIMKKNPKVLSKFVNVCAQDFIIKYNSKQNHFH